MSNIGGRLARMEKAQVAKVLAARGLRTFTTADLGEHYVETTRRPGEGFSYAKATAGIGGEWPAGMSLLTRAEFEQIEREGWQCIVVSYQEMDFTGSTETTF